MTLKYPIVIFEIIRMMTAALFTYAACSKLLDHTNFQIYIINHVTKQFGIMISYIVPLAELIIALLISFNKTILPGLLLFVILMGAFSLYIIVLLFSGTHLPCSCGGIISSMSWGQHLVFNLIFIALAIIALIIHGHHFPSLHQRKGTTYW